VGVSRKELSLLADLLQAQHCISEWDFLSAILVVQASDKKLTEWLGVIPMGLTVSRFLG